MINEFSQNLLNLADALPMHQRLISIDLGTTTIGLALSDISRTVASPPETLKHP